MMRAANPMLVTLTMIVAGVVGLAMTATAQHHGPGAAAGGHHGDGGQHHRAVDACLKESDEVIREGRGFGMAFAADQHGYPGPMHVLELRDRLKLTADQETAMQSLLRQMFAESRPKGARLLAAEARLRDLFADGRADADGIRAAVAEVERARAEVRLVHLLTHLRTRDHLSAEQRRLYHEARWSTASAPPAHK